MKKLNKFIPLVSAGAIATVVTPLSLTACSKGISLEDITNYSELGPEFEQYSEEEAITLENATDKYSKFAQDNKKDFIEDMKWGTWQNWMSFYEWGNHTPSTQNPTLFNGKLLSLKFGMTTPKFGKVKVAPPSTPDELQKEYPTISFKMKVEVKGTAEVSNSSSETDTIKHDTTLTAEVEYKDVIFFAYLANRNDKTFGNPTYESVKKWFEPQWFITTCYDSKSQLVHVYNQKPFSIKYNANLVDKVTKEGVTTETHGSFSGNIDTPEEIQTINQLKDYSLDGLNPSQGWMLWESQRPEAFVANAVMLDSATHYFDAKKEGGGKTEGYVEVNELHQNIFQQISELSDDDDSLDLDILGLALQLPPNESEFLLNNANKLDAISCELGIIDETQSFQPLPQEYLIINEGDADNKHYNPGDEHEGKDEGIQLKISQKATVVAVEGIDTQKIQLKIQTQLINLHGYRIYEEGMTKENSYIFDNLLFNINPTFSYKGGKDLPFAIKFAVTHGGGQSFEYILNFSDNVNRQIQLSIDKENI